MVPLLVGRVFFFFLQEKKNDFFNDEECLFFSDFRSWSRNLIGWTRPSILSQPRRNSRLDIQPFRSHLLFPQGKIEIPWESRNLSNYCVLPSRGEISQQTSASIYGAKLLSSMRNNRPNYQRLPSSDAQQRKSHILGVGVWEGNQNDPVYFYPFERQSKYKLQRNDTH